MGQTLARVLDERLREQACDQRTRELHDRTGVHAGTLSPRTPSRGSLLRFGKATEGFIDLALLPEDVALTILSHLGATDLCLAACVSPAWQRLADRDCLWRALCLRTWKFLAEMPAFNRGDRAHRTEWKRIYLMLDDGSTLFNMDPQRGLKYLVDAKTLPDDSPRTVARFLRTSRPIHKEKIGSLVVADIEVARAYVSLFDVRGMSIPRALR
eukprot:Opistho-1_new@8931